MQLTIYNLLNTIDFNLLLIIMISLEFYLARKNIYILYSYTIGSTLIVLQTLIVFRPPLQNWGLLNESHPGVFQGITLPLLRDL